MAKFVQAHLANRNCKTSRHHLERWSSRLKLVRRRRRRRLQLARVGVGSAADLFGNHDSLNLHASRKFDRQLNANASQLPYLLLFEFEFESELMICAPIKNIRTPERRKEDSRVFKWPSPAAMKIYHLFSLNSLSPADAASSGCLASSAKKVAAQNELLRSSAGQSINFIWPPLQLNLTGRDTWGPTNRRARFVTAAAASVEPSCRLLSRL